MKAIKCYIEKMLGDYEQKAETGKLSKSDLDAINYLCDLEAKVIMTCKMMHDAERGAESPNGASQLSRTAL